MSDGAGISGDPVLGSVGVHAWSDRFGIGTNAAMIFDSDCEGSCSGGDEDLGVFSGSVLIVSEDLARFDPDDEGFDFPIHFRFDYANLGAVTVESLDVADIEAHGGRIDTCDTACDAPGAPTATIALPMFGNETIGTMPVNQTEVSCLIVTMLESGAVDNVRLATPPDDVLLGRMIGGGHQFRLDGARITRGFQVRCDADDPRQNLEINWPSNQQFHLDDLTSAVCIDHALYEEAPPEAGFDHFTGIGVGKYRDGNAAAVPATVEFVFIDDGEPGSGAGGPDRAAIKITTDRSVGVLDITEWYLTGGNIQAHKVNP